MATILILDDRAANREFLVTLLGYVGHTLIEAEHAEEALALARAARPDLVIADVLMPAIDGFEFVRRLRNDPQIASTRVVFYTATYLESEARSLAEACGVVHLLAKPAEPQAVLQMVQLVLGEPQAYQPPPQEESFEQEHQSLLLNKLLQKVDELEMVNAGLERRVAERTAELAEANVRLSELNAFKDNLLAIASHDLRSPLGAIQTTADFLLDDPSISSESRRLIKNIYSSAQRLSDMVRKLLDLSRLEAGKVELDLMMLRVGDVAAQAIEGLTVTARSKQITCSLHVQPGEIMILADWTKLSQIFTNLLSNAIKFTPQQGAVYVDVASSIDGVSIQIADTGMGIPAEELPHLFEKFKRVHRCGTAGEQGNGLGLAIVRQLVDLHGGTIEVESKALHGSTFHIYLPYRSDERQEREVEISS